MADIGWNADIWVGVAGWYCRDCGAKGSGGRPEAEPAAREHACDPDVGCACPHEELCRTTECTQCCRFDITPEPTDCHNPAEPWALNTDHPVAQGDSL